MTSIPAFIALEPDQRLSGLIGSVKDLVRTRVGAQRHLDDPPHLTVVVNWFNDLDAVALDLATLARRLAPVRVELNGWHVFRDDPLTGGHTVVADPDAAGKAALRRVQDRVLAVTAPLRDPEASTARYRPYFPHLTAARQASVHRWGFPFTGDDWNPHVTVASIAPDAWDAVWSDINQRAPGHAVSFQELVLYSLEGGGLPTRVCSFSLEAP